MSRTITATVNYYTPTADGAKPYSQVVQVDPETRKSERNWDTHPVDVVIEDLRGKEDSVSLDADGFQFGQHESKVKGFYDEKEIREVYYPESVELLKKVTGASKVVVFDHSKLTPPCL
jgi:hypothetical protein